MLKSLVFVLALAACTTPGGPSAPSSPSTPAPSGPPAPSPVPAPPKPVTHFAEGVKCDTRLWLPEWNDIVAQALDDNGQALLLGDAAAADIAALCPLYRLTLKEERKAFWALFLAAVACPESGFKLDSKMYEAFGTWSEGLLQLSYGDERGHKRCEIKKTGGDEHSRSNPATGNIQDARVNLRCGVAILDDQVAKRRMLFVPKGSGAYWSVLYPPADKVMKTWTAYSGQLAFCRAPKP